MTKRRTLRGPSTVYAVVDRNLRVKRIYMYREEAMEAIEEGEMPFNVHDVIEIPFRIPFFQTITVK